MSDKPTVFVLVQIEDDLLRQIQEDCDVRVLDHTTPRFELLEALSDVEGVLVSPRVPADAAFFDAAPRLRVLSTTSVGYDPFDIPEATKHGVVVCNTPGVLTAAVANLTTALIFSLTLRLFDNERFVRSGGWARREKPPALGHDVQGQTLGVIGYGRIGQEVAKRALAFEMHVIGYDAFVSAEQTVKYGIEYAEHVHAMLPKIDYLTVHTPLIPETRHLISRAEIDLLKPGARLVNCARGGIYDESALVEGLKSGKLGGVALDVYEEEPCTDSPLFHTPGALCTPHLGASTEEAQTYVAMEAAELLVNYLTTGEVRHAVNTASIDPNTLRALRGYLDVAHRLGILLAQWHSGGARACRLTYRGQVTDENTRLLTAAFCAGLLEQALDEEVNIVNAEVLLRERGIELSESSRSTSGVFSSAISAEIDCSGTIYRAEGTVFGNNMPRLIRLREHRLEAYLDGNLLIFTHNDVPGIIGAIGTTLGKHQVNIAQMAVGRLGEAPGGEAIGVLNLDQVAPKEAIDEVLQHQAINSVHLIRLPGHGELPPWLPAG